MPGRFAATSCRRDGSALAADDRVGHFRYLLAGLNIEMKRLPNPARIRLDFLPAQKAVHRHAQRG